MLSAESEDDRTLLAEAIVHISDLHNPVLPFGAAAQWAKLVIQEFYNQYEEEKARNIPLAGVYEESSENVAEMAKLQVNFFITTSSRLCGASLQKFSKG